MAKSYPVAYGPLMLRFHRLMDAFTKSDDERDFYLDKVEGYIVYGDLDKGQEEIDALEQELVENAERYILLPKMTFYETKKFMEGYVHEKIYDIDTKEKLLDIIQSKEPRENFLEFVYDHLSELEKWQQYFHERSRIRIIEWLRAQKLQFVFEEDLELTKSIIEKIKRYLFETKIPKDVAATREMLIAKAKTYYSNEALNPRPKRGRPPKQTIKIEVEPQVSVDLYTMVPPAVRHFLYLPDISSPSAVTFSEKFNTEEEFLASLRGGSRMRGDMRLQALSEKLETLRHLSHRLADLKADAGKEDSLIRALRQTADAEGEPIVEKKTRGAATEAKPAPAKNIFKEPEHEGNKQKPIKDTPNKESPKKEEKKAPPTTENKPIKKSDKPLEKNTPEKKPEKSSAKSPATTVEKGKKK